MTIKETLRDKSMSIYKLSKASSIPYATCNDIVNGKSQLEKCSAETVYKIAHALGVSMESILSPCFIKRSSFENFKSTICHHVKEMGDIDFIIDTLESQNIRLYFDRKWYPECLYLLAMLDYISKENDVPLCDEYDDIRRCRLEKVVYPSSVLALSAASKNANVLKNAEAAAIPEFKRFNIIESDIRNVI
ncbi:MAG: helix-turn-helix transcriptional regulator [Eubacterium sp.]|nr:helix-turn-helix transcriptional regulator [Eubacterium sp.]